MGYDEATALELERAAERRVRAELERASAVLTIVSSGLAVALEAEVGPAQVATLARSLEYVLPGQENLRMLLALLFLQQRGGELSA